MSTRIAKIKGRYETIGRSIGFIANYAPAELDLTRFWGGKDNGSMLQLTIQGDNIAHIQLTQKQVEELAQTLLDSFSLKKYPSE